MKILFDLFPIRSLLKSELYRIVSFVNVTAFNLSITIWDFRVKSVPLERLFIEYSPGFS